MGRCMATLLRRAYKRFRMMYCKWRRGPCIRRCTGWSRKSESVMPEIRTLIKRYDASLPVYDLKTMDDLIKESLFTERGSGMLSTMFAILATTLAAVGLYGVMSYSVTRRFREFGLRMAVGATPRSLSQMVLR